MYLNQFSVRIPEGRETSGGYVEMQHGRQYTLVLRNNRSMRCDARVEIDGKHVGTWRIDSCNSIRLERPVNDHSRFTFYRLGSEEGEQAGLNGGDPDLGLVRVTFTPQKRQRPGTVKTTTSPYVPSFSGWRTAVDDYTTCCCNLERGRDCLSFSAGGTGLSGHSSQDFHEVSPLDYDYSQETTIHLRLVCEESKWSGPRPLVSASNPIPPRIW